MFTPTVMIALIAAKRLLKVEEALERQVNKWKANDHDYLDTVIAGDTENVKGLENMPRLCAREPILRLWYMYEE